MTDDLQERVARAMYALTPMVVIFPESGAELVLSWKELSNESLPAPRVRAKRRKIFLDGAQAAIDECSRWLLIADAPRDGTEVDLWVINEAGLAHRVADCHWHCGEWLYWGGEPEIGYLRPETDGAKAVYFQYITPPEDGDG